MIRTPDNKFGVFISALICISISQFVVRRQKWVLYFLGFFVCLNIYGQYFSGALSSSKSGHAATSYLNNDDYFDVSEKINRMEKVIVISPFDKCFGIYQQGRYHTCADLVLTNLSKQIINTDVENFTPLLEKYHQFTTIIYFNKNHENFIRKINLFRRSNLSQEFENFYESDNYLLYRRLGIDVACSNELNINCIKNGEYNMYTIPTDYYRYLGGKLFEKDNKGLIKSRFFELNNNISNSAFLIILQFLYISGLLTNIFLIIKFSQSRPNPI
jgi:hypothetical protein